MYDNNTEDIIKAKEGDKDVLSKILENNAGLIWSIVRRFKDRGHEMEDLYQIGSLGFIKAIRRFDTSFEVQLSTYAVPYILGEIKRFIRDDGPIKVSRSTKELCIKIKEIQKSYYNMNGKDIKIEEISKQLKVPKEEIAAALDSDNCVSSIYDSVCSDDDSCTILDKLQDDMYQDKNWVDKIALKDAMAKLNQRDRTIIFLRYYKGETQLQVAKVLGISQVQVSRIEKKILENMKKMLAC